ncbi:hypothetical protein [Pseudonocardia spinosispora]|uniref:hypothetical protein n=1 Tax=Pseudonocardia spinosispora TaxID=103441 RepID=UPI00040893ED|nr:hypothetical protein [Pseudonocardia spinosispora]
MNISDIVDRYTAVWNESDPAIRTKIVSALWANAATHTLESQVYRGREAIEVRVADAHEQFVATKDFRFSTVGQPTAHHDAIHLRWEMAPATGGAAVGGGYAVLLLDDDGLIHTDYQFNRS